MIRSQRRQSSRDSEREGEETKETRSDDGGGQFADQAAAVASSLSTGDKNYWMCAIELWQTPERRVDLKDLKKRTAEQPMAQDAPGCRILEKRMADRARVGCTAVVAGGVVLCEGDGDGDKHKGQTATADSNDRHKRVRMGSRQADNEARGVAGADPLRRSGSTYKERRMQRNGRP
ncbi:hypothetical protein F503_00617 [Ophiostoma piceae UAMH 11346]|uniref:Uncharacterized protein n=1 Tax=Ophiostoma piceae (strain UAMH 11346) TaxID=1262450 RepID=S3D3H6_OPHP1|nr:hypothetical protein F503_00617 [Ophiostoma piceae UAMH 11346]